MTQWVKDPGVLIPRIRFAALPTPVESLPRLSGAPARPAAVGQTR